MGGSSMIFDTIELVLKESVLVPLGIFVVLLAAAFRLIFPVIRQNRVQKLLTRVRDLSGPGATLRVVLGYWSSGTRDGEPSIDAQDDDDNDDGGLFSRDQFRAVLQNIRNVSGHH